MESVIFAEIERFRIGLTASHVAKCAPKKDELADSVELAPALDAETKSLNSAGERFATIARLPRDKDTKIISANGGNRLKGKFSALTAT